MASTRFYSDLPTHTVSISQLMGDETRFAAMPADWRVILTDVRKSTQALSEGRHQSVNLVATGSIIAALNIAHQVGISLPFFFGGDGATLLVPPSLAERIEQALLVHRANTRANFALDLRVGSLGLDEVYRQGARLQIAKIDINNGRINTIMCGTAAQRHALVETLQRLEDRADIRFGLHVSQASVVSCYVRDRRNQHIHFVDGLGGGYTQAASMLKAKMARQTRPCALIRG